MTNEEVIQELESRKLTMSMCADIESCRNANNAIDIAINSIEENTKLKAEIEQLKENYDTLAKQYSNVENSSIKYYNELKQLKSELKQSVKLQKGL